jgi:hypothetical protein
MNGDYFSIEKNLQTRLDSSQAHPSRELRVNYGPF